MLHHRDPKFFRLPAIQKKIECLLQYNPSKIGLPPKSADVLIGKREFAAKDFISDSSELLKCAKARFVARGFQKVRGVDSTYTSAPVVKCTSFRTLIALVAHCELELH